MSLKKQDEHAVERYGTKEIVRRLYDLLSDEQKVNLGTEEIEVPKIVLDPKLDPKNAEVKK